ncbi:putative transposase [Aquimarina sp. MAR_2010_214]|uniref:IS6 family transposase n=1 Tax=Aquimarina sp. MAR_2010_214 TaxID=1250026 RepID=UPI000C708C1F|nr:IS6 family transposase [Aquimarina sp. MAR_2010_214]PKV48074.1 putative transposase [Aquimarina sp. MAR_2010_214]
MYKHHRYPDIIIQQAIYFKFRFSLSYRDIEELMSIRGVKVDHSTIQRWVFKFPKGIEHNMNTRKRQLTDSWRLDETYIKVGGKDRYLYRAVDKQGNTIDFLLTKRRMKGSAQKFLSKAIRNNGKPRIINIDKSGANTAGIRTWNKRSLTSKKIKIRRVKYLNNIVEQDHRSIKRRIAITTGFKEFESAQRTLAGIEIIHIIRKGQILNPKNSKFKTFCSLAA